MSHSYANERAFASAQSAYENANPPEFYDNSGWTNEADDSDFCQCDLELTFEESDSGQCDCCGKQLP